jgi:hypothetical protein
VTKHRPVPDEFTRPITVDPWVDELPTTGHWVYWLRAYTPGIDPEWTLTTVYVGVTSHLRSRIHQHTRKWWWPAVDRDLCYFEQFPTRAEAEAEERVEIRECQPAMNRAGRLLVVTEL